MTIFELVETSGFKALCESFSACTGLATGTLDRDANILVSTGWQDICSCYHRVHPETSLRCRQSNLILAAKHEKGMIYKCKNGMYDVIIPIIVAGGYIADFYIGQFFFETPDREYFARQAEQFGFEKTAYLEALDRVPVYTLAQIERLIDFSSKLVNLFANMGLARKREEEINIRLRREIREHSRALAALRESEDKFRSIAENIPGAVYQLQVPKNGTGCFNYISPNARDLFPKGTDGGGAYADLVNLLQQMLTGPISRTSAYRMRYDNEIRIVGTDEIERWFEIIGSVSPRGEEIVIDGVILDITQRKQMEQRIKISEEKFSQIFHICPDCISITRGDGSFIDVNEGFCRTSGFSRDEIIGETSLNLGIWVDLMDREFMMENLSLHGEVINKEFQFRRKDGGVFPALLSARQIVMGDEACILIFARDITLRKRIERLYSLGTMSAGISHEINQPLQSISMIASGIIYAFENGKKLKLVDIIPQIEEICRQTNRINKIISQLRSFIRRDGMRVAPCILNTAVEEALTVVEGQLNKQGISLEKDLTDRLPSVLADSTLLEEIIVNLLMNAIEALGTVSSRKKQIVLRTYLDDGVVLKISDNGPGVCSGLGSEIFEPFFSSKTGMDNLGLGLAIVNSLVTAYGGNIYYESDGCTGTVFILKLPIVNKAS